MSVTFKIDYRSGIESKQVAASAIDALRAEYVAAGAPMPKVEESWSGGDWDVAIYEASEPKSPFSTAYFSIRDQDA